MISFLSVFPPYRGGIATFSDYLYTSLKKYDDVHAYNFKKLYPNVLFPGKSQKDVHNKANYASPLIHSMNPLNWMKSARFIAKDNPDTILYSNWHPFFSAAHWSILKRLKTLRPETNILGIAHNVIPHEYFPLQRPLTKKLFEISDEVILLSEQTVDEYELLSTDTPYTKLFHPVYEQPTPSATELELRQKYDIPEHDTVLIFFGLVRKYKGLDIMINALNKIDLDELNITPLIVGEFYTEKKPILEQINPKHRPKYHITDRFVSDEEAAEYLTLANAMVLPYRTASQSGVLSNAINFSLPVIIPDLPGLTEHIRDHKTGLIFETGNAEDLRDKIELFTKDNLYSGMSEHMGELKKELTWSKFAGRLYHIIREIN